MEDFLLLEMPIFRPRYKRWKKYGYQKLTERNNLKETFGGKYRRILYVLLFASSGGRKIVC